MNHMFFSVYLISPVHDTVSHLSENDWNHKLLYIKWEIFHCFSLFIELLSRTVKSPFVCNRESVWWIPILLCFCCVSWEAPQLMIPVNWLGQHQHRQTPAPLHPKASCWVIALIPWRLMMYQRTPLSIWFWATIICLKRRWCTSRIIQKLFTSNFWIIHSRTVPASGPIFPNWQRWFWNLHSLSWILYPFLPYHPCNLCIWKCTNWPKLRWSIFQTI